MRPPQKRTDATACRSCNPCGSAELYEDGTWARAGATPADGQNSYTATAKDFSGRQSSDTVSANLPASPSFTYDGNGNLTSDGTRTFEYDFENQLTNVFVSGQWRSEFVYDGMMRRRVRREFAWSGSAWLKTNEVRYVYDGKLVIQERDENNLPLVSYTRGLDLSGTIEGAGGIGGLLGRTDHALYNSQGAGHAYYQADGNGNVTCLISQSNVVVARYSYEPFGKLLAMSGPLAEVNLYRFSSKELHLNSGLSYYLYRYDEPNLQRWINRDPIGELGFQRASRLLVDRPMKDLNSYLFVQNDSLNLSDPFGLSKYSDCLDGCSSDFKRKQELNVQMSKKFSNAGFLGGAALGGWAGSRGNKVRSAVMLGVLVGAIAEAIPFLTTPLDGAAWLYCTQQCASTHLEPPPWPCGWPEMF